MGILTRKKTPIEQTPEYKEQKKASEDNTKEVVTIGTDNKTIEPVVTLNDVVLGMTDTEYRVAVLELLMELRDNVGQPKQ